MKEETNGLFVEELKKLTKIAASIVWSAVRGISGYDEVGNKDACFTYMYAGALQAVWPIRTVLLLN